MLYTEMVLDVLLDQRGGGLVKNELVRLRSGIWKLQSVVERTFAAQCSSGSFTLKSHIRDHLLHDSEKFESLSFMDAGLFEHSNVLMK